MNAAAPRPRPSSRQIGPADLEVLADLLHAGFPEQSRRYWVTALARLGERTVPEGYPRYGYVLECAGELVGAILLIFSTAEAVGSAHVRCNVSSWFVRPAFRGYAALLTSAALRFKQVSYVNISPAPNTWPILEAQGYRRFSEGVMVCAPALSPPVPGVKVRRLDPASARKLPGLGPVLEEPLRRDSVILAVEANGDVAPFVFTPCRIKRVDRGVMRLAWSPEGVDLVRYAGPLGRALLARGGPLLLLDANAHIPGLRGRFFPDRMPKYYKGPHAPRLNDLSGTEALLFGR